MLLLVGSAKFDSTTPDSKRKFDALDVLVAKHATVGRSHDNRRNEIREVPSARNSWQLSGIHWQPTGSLGPVLPSAGSVRGAYI
jgi:hypothetical protein